MAKKEEKKQETEAPAKKWDNFEQVIKVKAKIFDKGDEHGMAHRSGLDASKESNPDNLIPFIHAEGVGTMVMDFGDGYIVEDSEGRFCLEEKEKFEARFKKSK